MTVHADRSRAGQSRHSAMSIVVSIWPIATAIPLPQSASPEDLEFERSLERQLSVLEALLGRFLAVDAGAAQVGRLAADLEAARAVCEVAEGMMEGRGEEAP